MAIRQKISTIILCIAILTTTPVLAASEFGLRIPKAYIATTGTGQSDDGILQNTYYEVFSYDLALLEAGIENFNVVYYTSILPPESYEIPMNLVKKSFHHGSVLEAIMAKAGGVKGDTVAAGIGRVWAVDVDGKSIGGIVEEYEYVYSQKKIDMETAKKDAITQLTRSLDHALTIRGLKQKGEMKFNVTSVYIEKKYGVALAALGFVDFIYTDPLPREK